MNTVWDGDDSTVTYTATKDGAAVNLTGADCEIIVRSKAGVATTLTNTADTDLPNGKVTADSKPLTVGAYDLVLRVAKDGVTTTYPSDGPEVLIVLADIDATP
ncbi:MAG TPA: hypothetical protein VIP28_07730 [Nocardioides sp.]